MPSGGVTERDGLRPTKAAEAAKRCDRYAGELNQPSVLSHGPRYPSLEFSKTKANRFVRFPNAPVPETVKLCPERPLPRSPNVVLVLKRVTNIRPYTVFRVGKNQNDGLNCSNKSWLRSAASATVFIFPFKSRKLYVFIYTKFRPLE